MALFSTFFKHSAQRWRADHDVGAERIGRARTQDQQVGRRDPLVEQLRAHHVVTGDDHAAADFAYYPLSGAAADDR